MLRRIGFQMSAAATIGCAGDALQQALEGKASLDELDVADTLAAGAMGTVCAGVWRGQPVAVKTLHDTSAAQLAAVEQELLVHAALSEHRGVVRLLGANLAPPGCCIVMERCRCSLFARLHGEREALDRRHTVDLALEIAEAMAFLHSRTPPIVHRDLKSHNVLLADDGSARLCDFGLVNTKTVTAGTPNYMAPELFAGKTWGMGVDVFAFGVLVNEMFARELPWDGLQPLDIKEKVASGGSLMAWADELWKGRVIDAVHRDARNTLMDSVCPDKDQFYHSPCGYASAASA